MRKTINELDISITTGQIMSRVTASENGLDEVVETRKVIIPKSINADGTISEEVLPEENLRVEADPKKLTVEGDIVLKLSTPYDAARVDASTEGCLVPSFCAIVKNNDKDLDTDYLLAFLNSSNCKTQLSNQVSGAVMTVLSVGKVKNVEIPIPPMEKQHEIGEAFYESQAKIKTIKRIMELEAKRNDALINELSNGDK